MDKEAWNTAMGLQSVGHNWAAELRALRENHSLWARPENRNGRSVIWDQESTMGLAAQTCAGHAAVQQHWWWTRSTAPLSAPAGHFPSHLLNCTSEKCGYSFFARALRSHHLCKHYYVNIYVNITCGELTHLRRPWCWERLRAGREGDDRGWDAWMASQTQWTRVLVDSGSWWWIGRPGMQPFMGSKRVGHDWATELTDWLYFYLNSSLEDPSLAFNKEPPWSITIA